MTTTERAGAILGIPGRYFGPTTGGNNYRPGTFTMQRWVTSKAIRYYGESCTMTVTLRFDDDCRNGHNTFAMTADVRANGGRGDRDRAGGCMHELIAEEFPALAPLVKWHLCSTDGPMHYPGNALFFAGNRDCWGCLKGEPRGYATRIQFGDVPILHKIPAKFAEFLQGSEPYDFEVIAYGHDEDATRTTGYKFGPKFTFGGYAEAWHECPFDTEDEALRFLKALQESSPKFVRVPVSWGEGKERELDKARNVAIWPDATDAELCAPDLKERLLARLPALLDEFRAAMVGVCGFEWGPTA